MPLPSNCLRWRAWRHFAAAKGRLARAPAGPLLVHACLFPESNLPDASSRPAPDPGHRHLICPVTPCWPTQFTICWMPWGWIPMWGFFYADAAGRASLALDMDRTPRAPVVDRMVLRLSGHSKILQAEDFCRGEDGSVRLQPSRAGVSWRSTSDPGPAAGSPALRGLGGIPCRRHLGSEPAARIFSFGGRLDGDPGGGMRYGR